MKRKKYETAAALYGIIVTYAEIGDRGVFLPPEDGVPPVLILPEGASQERLDELASDLLGRLGASTA